MRNPLNKKLRGYQKAARDRFKLLRDKTLTVEEFVLYEFYIAITDWDPAHDMYGRFKTTDENVAKILGWNSRSTVCIHRQSLDNKGFLSYDEEGWISPKGFIDWELRKSGFFPKKSVSEIEQPKVNGVENGEQQVLENQQDALGSEQNQDQNDDYSLGSSKGKFNSVSNKGTYKEEPADSVDEFLKVMDSGNAEQNGEQEQNSDEIDLDSLPF